MRIRAGILAGMIALLVAGCGGGGGDDDSDVVDGGGSSGGDGSLSENSCSVLGLRVRPDIFTGSACGDVNRSPVVLLTTTFVDGQVGACSGTMVTPQHILTAGHCFFGDETFVSSIDVEVGGETIPAAGVAVHPDYSESDTAIFSDVAVVTLSRATGVAPVPLILSRSPQAGETIDIFGYGTDEFGGFGTLKSGQMRVDEVNSNHIVSTYGNDGSNTCTGDSGGPALQTLNGRPGIVGVTSSGVAEAECRVGDISLFANTQNGSNLDFVSRNAPGIGGI